MKNLLRALLLVVPMCMLGFAQTTDPAGALKDIQGMRMKVYQEANAKKVAPDFAKLEADIKAKATEMVKDVDPEKIDAKLGMQWAQLFQLAGMHHHACMSAQKYVATNPDAASKFQAQQIMLVSCNAMGEADNMQKTLASISAPAENSSELVSYVVYEWVDTIVAKKGPAAGLETLNAVESHLTFVDPKVAAKARLDAEKKPLPNGVTRPATIGGAAPKTDEEKLAAYEKQGEAMNTSTRWMLVEKRADILTSEGKQAEGLALMKKFNEALPADSAVHRTVEASILRATMLNAPATPLTFEKTIGDFPGLAAWKGKVVIVDFFAHWCGPCRASFPDMKKLYSDLHAKGVEIVQVTRYYGFIGTERDLKPEQEYAKMIDFKAQNGLPWPIIFGDQTNFNAYGVTGIPQTAVIDRSGKVHKIDIGYSAESFAEFRKTVEALVAKG